MAKKKDSNSQKSASSSSSSSSSSPSPRGALAAVSKENPSLTAASNERMVLRVKPIEKMKRLAELVSRGGSSEQDQEEERPPKSAKRRRSKASSCNNNKKKNDKFDPKKPKKPPTAFFYFLEDFRKGYQEQNPDVKSMRDVGKACGEKWKSMTYEEKVQYYDIASEKRREFDQAMAQYIKKIKECAEDEEEEGGEDETESDYSDEHQIR